MLPYWISSDSVFGGWILKFFQWRQRRKDRGIIYKTSYPLIPVYDATGYSYKSYSMGDYGAFSIPTITAPLLDVWDYHYQYK